MNGELKRAMKLMWGSKNYRKAFGVHPVVVVLYQLCAVLFGSFLMINEWLGEEFSVREYFMCSIMPPVFFLYLTGYFGSQFMAMFASGKSLLSFPNAKYVLTRGIAASRLYNYLVAVAPMAGIRLLSVCLGYGEVSMLDDIFLAYGVAFVLSEIIAGSTFLLTLLSSAFGAFAISSIMGNPLGAGFFKAWAEKAYTYVMPWWLVALLFVGLLAVGMLLGLFVLERAYKKRKVIYNQAEIFIAQK